MSSFLDSSLLGVTDGPVTIYLSQAEFETRLVHALLFESKLVMIDAYFFASDHLGRHIFESRRGDVSLFEEALRRGIIVPAVRSPTDSFLGVLGYLRGQRVQGYYDHMDGLARRLSLAFSRELGEVVFPDDVSERYDTLVCQALQRDTPPNLERDIWPLTERLRYSAVDRARSATAAQPAGNGLRRGELVRAAGRVLGVLSEDDDGVTDRTRILGRYRELHDRGSLQYQAAESFFDWIDEIHRINYARALQTRSSIFSSRSDDLIVLQSIMALPQDTRDRQELEDSFSVTVKIPSTRRLLEYPPGKLLDMRDFGLEWYTSVQRFISEPAEATRHEAERALEEYARRLRRISPIARYGELGVKAFAMRAAPTLATAASGFVLPEYGPYIATIGSVGYLAYRYLFKGKHQNAQVGLHMNIISR